MSDLSEKADIIARINTMRKKRHVLILAHNYQIPDIQDIADFVGDSLELSQKAAQSDAPVIAFCGVHFMAESAAIFSPDKTILIPDPNAGCSLASSITAEELRKWKRRYPNAVVVSYVNTSAEVKAESDYCCTSTNAVAIVNAIPQDTQILFVPDMFLGDFVAQTTGRDLIIYPGECHVHARVRPDDITHTMRKHRDADFLIHPECGCVSTCMHYAARGDISTTQTFILSTGGMMRHARQSLKKTHVVATETGILYRLRKENPDKTFLPLRNDMVCQFMKLITLPKLLRSLEDLVFEVSVPKAIAERARIPIERMLALSS